MRVSEPAQVQLLSLFLGLHLFAFSDAQNDRASHSKTPLPQFEQSMIQLRSSILPRAYLPGAAFFVMGDYTVDFHAFNALLPVETAASTLQSFYEDTAYLAATTLSTPAWRYLIRQGKLDLEIRSQEGNIPWMVVATFANIMREMSKKGFTNTYQVNYINRETGKLLTMSLWVGTVRWG